MAYMTRKFRSRPRDGRRGAEMTVGTIAKWGAVLAVLALLIGVGIWALDTVSNIETADANFCFAREDQHQVAVLVDNSISQQSGAQFRDYETGLMLPFEQAPANAVISFFTTALDGQGSLARPIFTICKPAETAQELAAIGAPAKPAPYLKRQAGEARERYRTAVADVIAAAQDDERRALDSPVLEMVQAVSKYRGFQGESRSLTIITDGLQRTEVAEFCIKRGHLPSYARFAETATYRLIKPRPLDGVDVTLLLVEQQKLPNAHYQFCTNDELRAWWPAFFEGNGAVSVDFNRIRVGAGT